MANLITSNSIISSSLLHLTQSCSSPSPPLLHLSTTPNSPLFRYSPQLIIRRRSRLVTRAAPPGTITYIFAFVFPLSLLAVTIFTSIIIADKLDKDFLEDLAVDQVILEGDSEDEAAGISLDEENTRPRTPRTRNRPKREAEVSSR